MSHMKLGVNSFQNLTIAKIMRWENNEEAAVADGTFIFTSDEKGNLNQKASVQANFPYRLLRP